jgi:hypothetical protein
VIGFIEVKGNQVHFDLDALVRQFEIDEVDPSAPLLTFRFFESMHLIR